MNSVIKTLAVAVALALIAGPAFADPVFGTLAIMAFQAGAPFAVVNGIVGVGTLGAIFSVAGTLALTVGTPFRTQSLRSRRPDKREMTGAA